LVALVAPLGAEPAAPGLSAAEQSQLHQNLALGTLLYRYDQSAWHVTDAALAAQPETIKTQSRGYVTAPAPDGLRTTFFGQTGTNYFPIYSAVWTGTKIEEEQRYLEGQQRSLAADELRLIEARRVALEGTSQLAMCSKARPNVIVVPDPADAALTHVYVMTPQSRDDSYPMGGHHRIDVKDGKIVAARAFAKSCLELGKQPLPDGAKPVGMFVTHLLDAVPTEIHVFTVLGSGFPLFVGVHDGRIYSVEVKDGKAQANLIQLKR
jgi:hypothetical protein